MAVQGTRTWDPQNLSAGYKYDPKNYDPADYARFKEARQARDQQSYATAKNSFDQLTERLNSELQKAVDDAIKKATAPTEDEVRQAAKQGALLSFNGDSTCFASLTYEDDGSDSGTGTVTATFTNGYGPYTAPLDLDTFLEWCSGSAGIFYNSELRDLFDAASKDKGE